MAKNPCACICQHKGIGYTCIAILFLLGLACILQIFFVPPYLDDLVNEGIDNQIIMTQAQKDANTEEYQNWVSNYGEDQPIVRNEYWIYNITNPSDVVNGADPVFDF